MMDALARIINQWALRSVRRSFDPYLTIRNGQEAPVLVSGIFRSGTSITTKLLIEAGLDAGPENHLLQATGKLKAHNPDGFLENYFFMELSRYLFHLSNSSGDNPPPESALEKIVLGAAQDHAFRTYALLELRDQRITNRNKASVLKKVSLENPLAYLSHAFGAKPVIKNPHFSVLEPYFLKLFPDATRVVVFRRPSDWVRSAQTVTPKADVSLYDRYYAYYLDHPLQNVIFFDYDQLIAHPKSSIDKLFSLLNITISGKHPEALISKRVQAVENDQTSLQSQNWNKLRELAINR